LRGLVIVGGGAAGIAAAIEAQARGIDALIVEAMNRLGGRAHSFDWHGHHLDLGCTWMHSAERNSLRLEAERLDAAIDRSATGWFSQYRDLGFSPEEQGQAYAAFEDLEQRMSNDPPASDRASDATSGKAEWMPFLNAISGYVNGAPLDRCSVADWIAYDNDSSDQNWRLGKGYGGLLARLGSSTEHKLSTAVTAISRLKTAVQVTTSDGVLEAERVIVTVPTATFQRIRFDPAIEGIFEAADQLPLGLANKMFLSLEDPHEFPHGAHLLGNPRSADTGSYFLNPLGMPIVEGFFGGGGGSRALEKLSDDEAFAFALDELAALLGSSMRKRLRPIAVSRWGHEAWIGGSYSHALPGHSNAREVLAQVGDDRIAFAGEAVSKSDYSTAHGAFDSGKAAVTRLLGDLQ
jgi:monoamine oxidase